MASTQYCRFDRSNRLRKEKACYAGLSNSKKIWSWRCSRKTHITPRWHRPFSRLPCRNMDRRNRSKTSGNVPSRILKRVETQNWYNYHEKASPKMFPSAEENMRLWQEIHVEKMLDNHPAHELHPSDLPDYHYWPMIQNDIEPKFTGQVSTLVQYQYHTDHHEIPRFHKNGVPKTPPQEQLWYIPLDDNGRCNWRAVMARWAGAQNMQNGFSVRGWNDRYLRYAYVDSLFAWRNGLKMLNINKPILYKHREINRNTAFCRTRRGTRMADPLVFVAIWWVVMGGTAAGVADYKSLNWSDEPWNYDMFYMKYFRNNGAYHPPI